MYIPLSLKWKSRSLMDMNKDWFCLGDCREIMQNNIPDESINLIIADPPFSIDFKAKRSNYNRNGDLVIDDYIEIPPEEYRDFSKKWIREAYRVLRKDGSMYVFSGYNRLEDVLYALRIAKFITQNHLIYKFQFGIYTTRKYVTSHFHLLFVSKTDKYYFNKIDKYPEDVWIFKRPYLKGKIKVPNKLPPALIKKILLYSSKADDMILDCFCGSGTVPMEIIKMNRTTNEIRHYIACEKSPKIYEYASNRIKEFQEQRVL